MKIHNFFKVVLPLTVFAGLSTPLFAADFEPLIGRWQRTDGGYVLEIRRVAEDGNAAVAALVGLVATPLLIFFSEWLSGQKTGAGGSSVLENGLIPTGLLAAALTIFFWILWRRYAATKNEAVQAIFVLLVVAYIVLTLAGVWFRGEGMALRWPG